MRRNLGRRKLIEPGLVTGVLELSLLDGHIDGEADDAIQQGSHDAQQRFHGRPAKRTDGGVSQDGIILLEDAVGSFGCGSQAVQLAEPFRSSGDFQQQTGSLGNRNMKSRVVLDDGGNSGTVQEWPGLWTSHTA